MQFDSYQFFIFFPIVVLLYYIIPHRFRYIWLLVTSLYFYMCWNAKYALLLLTSITITYLAGVAIGQAKNVPIKKLVVAISFVSNLSILAFFKYFDFIIDSLNALIGLAGLTIKNPSFDVLLPVGISFYTFQALGYTVDVYRGQTKAEKNFFKYAVFVSFFPQLVAGPIERSSNLLKQFDEKHSFDINKISSGLMQMVWGFFLKLCIADRISPFVEKVYSFPDVFHGGYVIIATILFGFQIYCDFAGYTHIAIGAARVMGFELMENFNAPYMSKSVSEFWRRWHISLSSWFRDYLYIPLGGNRKGKARKWLNLLIVFAVSGLWHGAAITFVIWGVLNGVFQVVGEWLAPIKKQVCGFYEKIHMRWLFDAASVVLTFIMVDFAWLFFRANSMADAKLLLTKLFTTPIVPIKMLINDGFFFELGVNRQNFFVLLICLAVLVIADVCRYKGICIREKILSAALPIRWCLSIGAVLFVLVFGIWGSGYEATQFIYFQF